MDMQNGPVLPVGGHTFALAKDVCKGMSYDGPAWAPFNLWQQYAYATASSHRRECARVLLYGAGARELWALIAERYDEPDKVALALPMRCAEFQKRWRATPKVTPSEYRDARLSLSRHAELLATELSRFFYRWDYEEDRGEINFTQLLTEQEQETLEAECTRMHGAWRMMLGDGVEPGIIPSVPEMLRRVATLLEDDAKVAPLQRPRGANTERNFFTRSLIRYFLRECGEMSPLIVANTVSMFFPQGITENEVSKQADFHPDGRRIPWGSETSPSK